MRTRIATRWNVHNAICFLAVLASAAVGILVGPVWIFYVTSALAGVAMIKEEVPDE